MRAIGIIGYKDSGKTNLARALAREIVGGRAGAEDCVSLQPIMEVKIDGQPMPMNPFISGIVRSTILGVLSLLKGFKKGRIEISI